MHRTTDPGLPTLRRQRGFTLVEAIVVIVITGIIAGIVAVFVRVPVQSQLDTQARADMADAADLALRRMTRELRLALPFTVATYNGDTAIQFLLTKTGGRFFSVGDNPPATLLPLDFVNGATQFDVVGTAPTGKQAIVAGDYIAIYNLGVAPNNAYDFAKGANNISRVAGVNGNRITLATNYFAGAQTPLNTFQVVTGTVTYICTPAANGAGVLRRHFTRNIVQGVGNLAALSDTATAPVLSTMVSGCQFRNTPLPRQQDAGTLMTLSLFLQHANGERAQLIRQTQLDNP